MRVALVMVIAGCSVAPHTAARTETQRSAVIGVVTLSGPDGSPGATGPVGASGTGLPPPCALGQIVTLTPSGWACANDQSASGGAGTLTAVITNAPVTGGTTSGAASLAIDGTGCAVDDVLESTGASYACGADDTALTPSPVGAFSAAVAGAIVSIVDQRVSGVSGSVVAQSSTLNQPTITASTSTAGGRAFKAEGTAGTRMPVIVEDASNQQTRVSLHSNTPNERWLVHALFSSTPDQLRFSYRNGGTETEVVRADGNGLVRFGKLQIGANPFNGGNNGGLLLALRGDGSATCTQVCQDHGFTGCANGPNQAVRIADGSPGTLSYPSCDVAAAVGGFNLCPCGY